MLDYAKVALCEFSSLRALSTGDALSVFSSTCTIRADIVYLHLRAKAF